MVDLRTAVPSEVAQLSTRVLPNTMLSALEEVSRALWDTWAQLRLQTEAADEMDTELSRESRTLTLQG